MEAFAIGAAVVFLIYLAYDRPVRICFEHNPTGATAVLYENELGATLQVGGVDIARIDRLDTLMKQPNDVSVTRDWYTINVPHVKDTELVETSGFELEPEYRKYARIAIKDVTLVEMEHQAVQYVGVTKMNIIERTIDNKVVIAYEVTNKDELIDMMVAGGPPKTIREQLQQLITPTKGR